MGEEVRRCAKTLKCISQYCPVYRAGELRVHMFEFEIRELFYILEFRDRAQKFCAFIGPYYFNIAFEPSCRVKNFY